MKKKIMSIVLALACVTAGAAAPASAALTLDESFERVTAVSEIKGSGLLINTGTNAALEIKTETNSTETNKYLRTSGSGTQLVTNGFLKSGKSLVSMRIRADGSNQLLLRNNKEALYLLNFDGTNIRLLNDSSKTLAYDKNSWFRLYIIVDTDAKSISAVLSKEGTANRISHSLTYTGDAAAQITENAHLRAKIVGTGYVEIDDLHEGSVFDKRYISREDFEQHGEGAVTANLFSKRSGLNTNDKPNTLVEKDEAANTYIKILNKTILHNLPIFSGKQVYEFDMKIAPDTAKARAYLYLNSSNIVELVRYMKADDAGNPTVKIGNSYYAGEAVESLKNGWVRVSAVIDKDNDTCSIYYGGRFYETITGLKGATQIRLDVNNGAESNEGALYIDNVGCYVPGEAKLEAVMPEKAVDGMAVALKSNNIIYPESIDISGADGVVWTAKPATDGTEYSAVLTGLKRETDYSLKINAADLFGQGFGEKQCSFKTEPYRLSTEFSRDGQALEALTAGAVKVTAAANGSTSAWNGSIIIAHYDGAGLKSAKVFTPADTNAFSADFTAEAGDTIKVLAWEGLDSLIPIVKAVSFDKDGIKPVSELSF